MDLRQFNVRMRQLGDTVVRNANKAKQSATRTLIKELATHTPADEGTAISNWRVSFEPISGTIPAHAPGKLGDTKTQNTQATIDAAEAVISQCQPGQTLHTQNNLPYIDLLNAGHSKQAPPGFIESAVAVAREKVRGVKVLKDD